MSDSLSLWKAVVFVDWNGVLSCDPFWVTILRNRRHPLNVRLSEVVGNFFRDRNDVVNSWMRGELSYARIVEMLDVELENGPEWRLVLQEKLVEDCMHMEVHPELLDILEEVKGKAFVVIATDNMDCFYEQVVNLRLEATRRRKRRPRNPRLSNTALFFDDVVCSSNVGVMKRDDPQRFFGSWLIRHGLKFEQSILLDDGAVNCDCFRNAGGKAIRVTKEDRSSGFSLLRSEIFAVLNEIPEREVGNGDAEKWERLFEEWKGPYIRQGRQYRFNI